MSKDEIETEQPNKIINIVIEILNFNKKIQSGKGLKILGPDQIIDII